MSKKDEALKLALEGAANYIDALGGDSRKYRQALTEQPTVKQSLTVEPARQPHCNDCGGFDPECPLAQQQEPIAWWLHGTDHVEFEKHGYHDGHEWTPIYTSPPASKPWVGLTDEEIDELDRKNYGFPQPVAWRGPFARAVEAKLKERNA